MCRTHAAAEMAGGVNVQGRELLPANVIPRHYDLTLEPDFEKLTFDGTVIIDVDVAEDSQAISLHTLELDVHSAKLSSSGQAVWSVSYSPG
jgi:aminopeptidase 2